MRVQYLVKALLIIFSVVTFASCDGTTKTEASATDTAAVTQQAPAAVDSGKLVGAWHDESIKTDKGEEIAYEVVSSGHKVYIQPITFTGTNLTLNDTPPITPSASEIRLQGDRYVSVDQPTQSYKIDKEGNLLLYDDGKLVAVCKKLL